MLISRAGTTCVHLLLRPGLGWTLLRPLQVSASRTELGCAGTGKGRAQHPLKGSLRAGSVPPRTGGGAQSCASAALRPGTPVTGGRVQASPPAPWPPGQGTNMVGMAGERASPMGFPRPPPSAPPAPVGWAGLAWAAACTGLKSFCDCSLLCLAASCQGSEVSGLRWPASGVWGQGGRTG